jgi:hypothetical protein
MDLWGKYFLQAPVGEIRFSFQKIGNECRNEYPKGDVPWPPSVFLDIEMVKNQCHCRKYFLFCQGVGRTQLMFGGIG